MMFETIPPWAQQQQAQPPPPFNPPPMMSPSLSSNPSASNGLGGILALLTAMQKGVSGTPNQGYAPGVNGASQQSMNNPRMSNAEIQSTVLQDEECVSYLNPSPLGQWLSHRRNSKDSRSNLSMPHR
jgi:hypothetical protein